MPRWVAAVVAIGAVGASGDGRADSIVRQWLDRARADLAAAALANVPPPVPPVAVKVTWRPKRIASINLGAPLLALVGGDLDGDKKAELYAVTERDVVAFDVGKKVTERARAALPDDLPAIRPRDQVATAYIDRGGGKPELRVMTSSRAHGGRYALDGKALRELGQLDQFPVCAGKTLDLVPGRNHFGTVEAPIYGLRCRDDLVDRAGTALSVTAELGPGGALAVTITPRTSVAGTTSVYTGAPVDVPAVGYAYDVADLDRDGKVELIAAGAGAPGDRDAIKVIEIDGAAVAKKPKHRKGFTGGVVAIAVADVDGDGADEVIGAVRLPGSTKVDLWQLNP